ncbi:MAG: sigma-70 family RNA polymerase sigma factor [Ruminiclostridium sp.]|nr:sigma-70 family RNA polymerase sigma factor [Ruminiclostridium sp.]
MDELLVRKAIKGDRESFGQIVAMVRDQAYRVAYCYLRNEEDSMDAVCDAVEKAFCNLKKLKEPRFFKTWFIRIIINECKLQLRNRKKVEYLADDIFIQADISNKEENLDLNKVLDQLPALDRLLIYMKYYMGYTLEEIAAATDMPTGTVKTRIYGNLKVLKSRLEVSEA